MECLNIEGLKDCSVKTSYLRPDSGFTVIPWLYSLIVLSLHLPLVFVRILRWETGQWLTMLMASFCIGLLIIEYASTQLNASQVYVWTPIVAGLDIGGCLQVFILVLEREGERLPMWNKIMRMVHWRVGLNIFKEPIEMNDSGDGTGTGTGTNGTTPSQQSASETRPATVNPASTWSLHLLLGMSLFCFTTLFVLQFVGLVYTGIGLNTALHQNMTEVWCSPSFLVGQYLFDSSCNNYTITLTPASGVGCITVAGNQPAFLKATMTVVILEIAFEIVDAGLLILARSDKNLWGPFKVKRPWFTMICGIAVWAALIGIGVTRGRNSALPITAGWIGLNGPVEGSCKTALYCAGLRGETIAWSDGAFGSLGSAYVGGM
jgi:hypothetical protein